MSFFLHLALQQILMWLTCAKTVDIEWQLVFVSVFQRVF